MPMQARNLADEQVGETVPEPTWLYLRHVDAVRPLRTQGAHNIRTRGSLPRERSNIRMWLSIAHHHFSACRPGGVHIRIYDGICPYTCSSSRVPLDIVGGSIYVANFVQEVVKGQLPLAVGGIRQPGS